MHEIVLNLEGVPETLWPEVGNTIGVGATTYRIIRILNVWPGCAAYEVEPFITSTSQPDFMLPPN